MQQGSGNIQIEIFAGSTGFVIGLRTLWSYPTKSWVSFSVLRIDQGMAVFP